MSLFPPAFHLQNPPKKLTLFAEFCLWLKIPVARVVCWWVPRWGTPTHIVGIWMWLLGGIAVDDELRALSEKFKPKFQPLLQRLNLAMFGHFLEVSNDVRIY